MNGKGWGTRGPQREREQKAVARRWREKSQHKLGIWRKPLILCQGFGRQVLGLLPAQHLAPVSHSPAQPSSMINRSKERERGEREGGEKKGEREVEGRGRGKKKRGAWEGRGKRREELRQFGEDPKRNKMKIQKSRILAIPFTTWTDISGSAGGAKASPLWGSPGWEWLCF